MTEPAPRRHRRRERRRTRPTGMEAAPPAAEAGGTSGEYAAPAGTARRFGRRHGAARTPATDTGPAGDRAGPAAPGDGPAAPGDPAGPWAAGDGGGPPDRDGGPVADGPDAARAKPRPARRPDAERGLRGIVGSGPSQVGVLGAMRARDAARPTAEDLAAAERDLTVVRRHYVPPDTDPRAT